jgi:magnesium-protoporphyrin IX monomethyl ester (oxidative) cyclase
MTTASTTAPHLREDLLAPRFYTTEIDKAARTCLDLERPAFEAMLGEMEADYNRDHFDRQAPLGRLQALSPGEKQAYESYLVRSCVSEFSGFCCSRSSPAACSRPSGRSWEDCSN